MKLRKNQQGIAMALSVVMVLVFAVLSLPLVHNAMMASRHRGEVNKQDKTFNNARSAHNIVHGAVLSPESVGANAVDWDETDLTTAVSGGWTLHGGKIKLTLPDGTVAMATVEGIVGLSD